VGTTDKIKSQAQQAKGKAKEWVGSKSNNEQMMAEGQRDQESSKMKQQANDQNMQNKNMQQSGQNMGH
jgi:uncharacterized protein YjbJ (UPF0337 family)